MIRYDFHAHRPPAQPDTVAILSGKACSVPPHCFRAEELHPWEKATALPENWEQQAVAADVIGEVGLDRLRGAPWEQQLAVLDAILAIAHRHGKPVTLHIVRGLDELLQRRRRYPLERWLWHGWRGGNPANLDRVLQAGIRVGIGIHTPETAIREIGRYPELLALESDDEPESLPEVYRKTAAVLGRTEVELCRLAQRNFAGFLGRTQVL